MRRFVCLLLTLLLLLPITLTAHATSPAPNVSAASYVLMDATSGTLLADKDAHMRRPMASTTKIMTALVVLETLPLDTVVTVPREAVGIEGSSIYLYEGEQITVQTLLYALMLSSANDAAVALAIACDGSVAAFATRMNEKAAALELTNTHFCNPNGLHEAEHYTTAFDLARLTCAALANETFASIVQTKRYTAAQSGTDATRLFLNHNRLLRTLDGAVGVKTGFTRAAGRCLVSATQREGLTLVAVTLNAPDDWRDHTTLHDWGHERFSVFSPDVSPISLPVVGGDTNEVILVPANAPRVLIEAEAEVKCTRYLPPFLYGGIEAGERCGTLRYTLDGTLLCEVSLVAQSTVAAERKASLPYRILQFLKRMF